MGLALHIECYTLLSASCFQSLIPETLMALKDQQECKVRCPVYFGLYEVSKIHSKQTAGPELEAKMVGARGTGLFCRAPEPRTDEMSLSSEATGEP